uniref:Uncharacterized protein n=1 Tax=Arundo donax TaxID=35708 RepID=A0A0A8XN67_ARUDO
MSRAATGSTPLTSSSAVSIMGFLSCSQINRT